MVDDAFIDHVFRDVAPLLGPDGQSSKEWWAAWQEWQDILTVHEIQTMRASLEEIQQDRRAAKAQTP